MKRIGLLSLALVLALGSLGIGYAAWTDTLTISGTVATGHVEWEFSGSPAQSDSGLDDNVFFTLEERHVNLVHMDKDVGSTSVAFTNNHLMTVTINNAYPFYYNHIAFIVHGLGVTPLKIWKVIIRDNNGAEVATLYANGYVYLDLDDDGEFDLELWWGDNFGYQMHASYSADISFDLLVLQPAPQNASLTFSIELVAIQYNEYTPGPIQ